MHIEIQCRYLFIDLGTTVIWASLCAVSTYVQQRCRCSRTAFLLTLAIANTGTYTNDGFYRSLRLLIAPVLT